MLDLRISDNQFFMTDSLLLNTFDLIFSFDSNLIEIIILSLSVSLTAVIIATLISIPAAGLLSIKNFYGKDSLVIFINALMGLPPVVVGLVLYLLLSSQGALAAYELLYTPIAMVIAQIIIVTPIITALSKNTLDLYFFEYNDYFKTIHSTDPKIIKTLLWEARYSLLINSIAGMGRALSEVGAVIIVGGNIAHHTRMMTMSVVLETSRGEFALALSLGILLIIISILINIFVHLFSKTKQGI